MATTTVSDTFWRPGRCLRSSLRSLGRAALALAREPGDPRRLAQLLGRWAPSCLIFLVDSSIWYSLFSAAVGTYKGFQDNEGILYEKDGAVSKLM